MTKQERIEELENIVAQYTRYAHDLKYRHSLAIDALSDLAAGIGTKPNFYIEGKHGWDTCMIDFAKTKLAYIAKQSLREPA